MAQVAAAAGMGIATYKKTEAGSRAPDDGELFKIARALDFDVEYFLDESAQPFPPLIRQAAAQHATEEFVKEPPASAGEPAKQPSRSSTRAKGDQAAKS